MSLEPRSAAHRAYVATEAPLLVKPRQACEMLACGNTRLYELLAAGELQSFKDGKSRKIVVQSILAYIKRRISESEA